MKADKYRMTQAAAKAIAEAAIDPEDELELGISGITWDKYSRCLVIAKGHCHMQVRSPKLVALLEAAAEELMRCTDMAQTMLDKAIEQDKLCMVKKNEKPDTYNFSTELQTGRPGINATTIC